MGALPGSASQLNARAAERILRGPLWIEVGRFGLPLAFGMGLQTAFNLVDAYLIARLPPPIASPSLGAIGICDQLAALGTIISYGLSVATAAMLSRRQGAGDFEGLKRIAWQSTMVVLALAAGLGCLGVFGARWLIEDIVGAKGKVASLSIEYLGIMLPGSFSIFLLLHLTAIQRALGSSKTPVAILISANALNLLLAVLMIYGPGAAPALFGWGPPIARVLGVPRLELLGGAWATVLARTAMLLPLVIVIMRRFSLFAPSGRARPDLAVLRSLWRMAWPSSAQLVVRLAAMLAVHSLVARAYTTSDDQAATTALGVVFRLETMALFVGLGWGSAAQTFIGQNLGAANPNRAQKSGYCAAAFNCVSMGLLALGYHVYGREIVVFFDSDPRVVEIALGYLKWVAPSYLGLGIGITLAAALQGAGAARQALALDSLVVFTLELPAATLVVLGFGLGHESLWQVVAITYVAFAVVVGVSYSRGHHLGAVMR